MLQEKRTWIFVMVDLYAGSPTSRIVVRIFRLGASDPSTKQLLLPDVGNTVKTEENRNETSDEIETGIGRKYQIELKQDLQISKLPHLAISAFLCLSFSTRSAFPRAMISSLFLASSCTNNQD